jgi:hypothetical protein
MSREEEGEQILAAPERTPAERLVKWQMISRFISAHGEAALKELLARRPR